MAEEKTATGLERVDKTLVSMFLKMTPEERIKANDNMVRTIQELRHAIKKKKADAQCPATPRTGSGFLFLRKL